MSEIDELVEKFRSKLLKEQECQKYKDEVATPVINKIFNENFVSVFKNLSEELNNKLGAQVIGFQQEGTNRFTIQGKYHRVIFQRGKVEFAGGIINVSIIPVYIWKGVTKHLGPISIIINPETSYFEFDLSSDNIKVYSKNLFSNLVDDNDFFV